MEEVIGSIPIRSIKQLSISEELQGAGAFLRSVILGR